MRRGSLVIMTGALAAAATLRMAAAAARSDAADNMILVVDGRRPVAVAVAVDGLDLEPVVDLTLPRALGAWFLSWPLDGLSRTKLAIARSVVRSRVRTAARERPAARARDGPP